MRLRESGPLAISFSASQELSVAGVTELCQSSTRACATQMNGVCCKGHDVEQRSNLVGRAAKPMPGATIMVGETPRRCSILAQYWSTHPQRPKNGHWIALSDCNPMAAFGWGNCIHLQP